MNEQLAITDNRIGALKVRDQVNQIQYLMQDVLKEGEHYGKIPGVQKPSLMQSGAEKIAYMFKLVPHYTVSREDIPGMPGHREYTVTCTLTGSDGLVKGEAIASCSTMESRYRWRDGWEDTGEPIPNDARDRKQQYRAQGLGMKKVNGNWLWVRFLDRQENQDIADTWNTVLQMAEKRAFVRAIRCTTAASDIFTQDVEETMYDYAPQQTYEPPAQSQLHQGLSDDDKLELRRLTNECATMGYDERETAIWLYDQYNQGGISAAKQAATQLMAQKIPGDVTDVSEDDIEF